VGGVTSIPTTLLGGIIGIGTGAAHGPWFKIGKDGKKEEISKEEVTDMQIKAEMEGSDE
jgi:hypothetical protein